MLFSGWIIMDLETIALIELYGLDVWPEERIYGIEVIYSRLDPFSGDLVEHWFKCDSVHDALHQMAAFSGDGQSERYPHVFLLLCTRLNTPYGEYERQLYFCRDSLSDETEWVAIEPLA